MTKCFSVPWKVHAPKLLSFLLPQHSLHMEDLFMLGCVKKSTCYLRAGQINPEEDLLECKSKALFSWIVLQCLESKSIMSMQHSNISKEFGKFAIHHSL